MQQKILNDRYELEQKIGEGGMARVYRGRDLRLNRQVAIKVLHGHYAGDSGFLQRFHHEAQAAANLRHPNIVDVYDVGQDGDVHYIVMEYVAGSDLKALLRGGTLAIERAVEIAEAAANGLEAAHRVGMVHRDIKPQNIIVGDQGQVKITDFGIAKSRMSTALTETGVTFGTADYISPEQARGLPATPRSDIYSLGVTMYEMLTGRLPFTGDSSIAVAMQHVSAEPPPPRMYSPRIPPQLEAIVLRALNKDPDARPTTAREVARLLANYRDAGEQPTMVRPMAPQPTAPRPAPRPAPQPAPRPAAGGSSYPRPMLPVSRPAVVTQTPPQSRGMGFGGFILGLLLLAGVLGLVYGFAVGWFNELFSFASGTLRPPITVVSPTAAPTALPQVPMPALANLTKEQAEAALRSIGLEPREDGSHFDPAAPLGLVIDQAPAAGVPITQTSVVTYALSLGAETVEIPADVIGMRADDAQARLQAAGLQVQQVRVPCDTTMSRGFVGRIEPNPGTKPRKGEQVTLYVSDGNNTTVPNVYLKSLDAARQLLQAANLQAYLDPQGKDKLGALYDQVAPNTVVSNDPPGGAVVACGTTVNLGVRAP